MRWPRIVEVENAPTPVVVYEDEDGELIVEVDAELKGRKRASAIIAAVRSHKRNFGSVILLPIALYAWEPIKSATVVHPGVAISTTAASAGLIATAAVLPSALDDHTDPLEAAPLRTIVATVTATPAPAPAPARTPAASSTARPTPRATPRATRTRPPVRVTRASPDAPVPRVAQQPATRRPEPRPSRDRQPSKGPTPKASASKPANRATTAPPVGGADVDSLATPTSEPGDNPAQPPDPSAVDTEPTGRAAPDDPAPQPPPGRDCLIEVNLDPLANVCVG